MGELNSNKISVLVLYQYPHEDNNSKPSIITDFEKLIREAGICGIDAEAVTLSNWSENKGEPTIFEAYKNACIRFNYAVAFITHDNRKASQAGNLWFELGYWIAVNGTDRLLVVMENYPAGDERQKEVNIISDLSSLPYEKINSGNDSYTKFTNLVKHREKTSKASSNSKQDILRIQEVLRGTKLWEHNDFDICYDENSSSNHKCKRVKPSLSMIAELVRFCQSEHEVLELIANLEKIVKKKRSLSVESKDQFRNVVVEIKRIVGTLVQQINNWTRRLDENKKQWLWNKRLTVFLEKRGGGKESSTTITVFVKSLKSVYDKGPPNISINELNFLDDGASETITLLHTYLTIHTLDVDKGVSGHFEECKPNEIVTKLRETINGFAHNSGRNIVIPQIFAQ